ncbi:PREDICTED: mapk-regulated corepressor-interacting protein 1 isoform X2 [Capra hircus]|uniref:mapk-regulated corepressor-interacting protein 1 isoform X2 n=1 Tax=Capra hircus TaxID=9925 RepID=UPI000846BFAB|nr:PREDICTED: mapk-regulated corepressor-interacting protein 1 isoform X2 [Capra hircus]
MPPCPSHPWTLLVRVAGWPLSHSYVMGLPFQRPRGSGSGVRGPDTPAMTSSPVSRVVYNGKRNSSPRSPPNSSEIFTPAHEENVRFIYEAWQGVERDLRSQMSGSERGLVEEYVEKVPNPSLKTFKPIDLSDLKRRNTQDAKKS